MMPFSSPRSRKPRRRLLCSANFVLGGCLGVALSFLYQQLTLALLSSSLPPPAPRAVPLDPPRAGHFHAIIIPAGGQLEEGPPAHVLARLERALQLYRMAPSPKPYLITTAHGTPHKPCPRDVAGFERHEAQDNAQWLIRHGVPPDAMLEESLSLETVGNAFFTRVIHTDTRSLRRLVVVNNRFHMPRTRAVFEHVFRVPPLDGHPPTAYELEFVEVDDRLPRDVLVVREEKESVALPKFLPGGPWQSSTPHLRALHQWLFEVHLESNRYAISKHTELYARQTQENTAYATKRLLEERKPVDAALLKSY